jgi:hypothetical protein
VIPTYIKVFLIVMIVIGIIGIFRHHYLMWTGRVNRWSDDWGWNNLSRFDRWLSIIAVVCVLGLIPGVAAVSLLFGQ